MNRSLEQTHRFTYGDYKNWPDDERWEIIDGIPYRYRVISSPLFPFT